MDQYANVDKFMQPSNIRDIDVAPIVDNVEATPSMPTETISDITSECSDTTPLNPNTDIEKDRVPGTCSRIDGKHNHGTICKTNGNDNGNLSTRHNTTPGSQQRSRKMMSRRDVEPALDPKCILTDPSETYQFRDIYEYYDYMWRANWHKTKPKLPAHTRALERSMLAADEHFRKGFVAASDLVISVSKHMIAFTRRRRASINLHGNDEDTYGPVQRLDAVPDFMLRDTSRTLKAAVLAFCLPSGTPLEFAIKRDIVLAVVQGPWYERHHNTGDCTSCYRVTTRAT